MRKPQATKGTTDLKAVGDSVIAKAKESEMPDFLSFMTALVSGQLPGFTKEMDAHLCKSIGIDYQYYKQRPKMQLYAKIWVQAHK